MKYLAQKVAKQINKNFGEPFLKEGLVKASSVKNILYLTVGRRDMSISMTTGEMYDAGTFLG